jgi:hypothetical protein
MRLHAHRKGLRRMTRILLQLVGIIALVAADVYLLAGNTDWFSLAIIGFASACIGVGYIDYWRGRRG